MPYYRKKDTNILYLHIPKTGGMSVQTYFSKRYGIKFGPTSLSDVISQRVQTLNNLEINPCLKHITYSDVMRYKTYFQVETKNLTVFATVRNPYDRAISDLFYWNKINVQTTKEEVYTILIQNINENKHNHGIPQYKFVTTEIDSKTVELVPGIKILHTETLDFEMRLLGYKDFNIRINCNLYKNVNYSDYLNSDSIALINEYYDKDFEMFGYVKRD